MEAVLDSSVLISIFSEKDKFHNSGLQILDQVTDKKIVPFVPTLALPEVCGAITRTIGKKIAKKVRKEINDWISSKLLFVEELSAKRMQEAAAISINFSIKGSDSIFVALSSEKTAALITFDEKLKKKIKGKIRLFEI